MSTQMIHGGGRKRNYDDELYNFGKNMYKNRKEIANEVAKDHKYNSARNAVVSIAYGAAGAMGAGKVAVVAFTGTPIVRGYINDRFDNKINKFEDKCAITNSSLKIQEVALKNKGIKEVGKKVKEVGIDMYKKSKKTVKNAINNAIKTERNIVRPTAKRLIREMIRTDINISRGMRFRFR